MVRSASRQGSPVIAIGFATAALVLLTALAACSSEVQVAQQGPSAEQPSPTTSPETDTSGILDVDALWETFALRHPSAERPEARFIRYVDEQEIPQAMADCLIAAGWTDVTVRADGGVAAGPSDPAQQQAFDLSMFVCMVQYPLDPKYTVVLSSDRLELLYDYYVGSLSSCLGAEGYSVDGAPSKTLFVETFYNVGWTPYADINENFAGTEEAWAALNEACPQWPPGFYD